MKNDKALLGCTVCAHIFCPKGCYYCKSNYYVQLLQVKNYAHRFPWSVHCSACGQFRFMLKKIITFDELPNPWTVKHTNLGFSN